MVSRDKGMGGGDRRCAQSLHGPGMSLPDQLARLEQTSSVHALQKQVVERERHGIHESNDATTSS